MNPSKEKHDSVKLHEFSQHWQPVENVSHKVWELPTVHAWFLLQSKTLSPTKLAKIQPWPSSLKHWPVSLEGYQANRLTPKTHMSKFMAQEHTATIEFC